MLRSLRLVLLCSFVAVISGNEKSMKIIGGTNAPANLAPYQVSLRNLFNRHTCGGSIINDRWVLTATHCLIPFRPFSFVVGTTKLDTNGTRYKISRTVTHIWFYTSTNLGSDIGLVKSSGKIAFNDLVQPVNLPFDTPDLPLGTVLTATGWGVTTYPSNDAENDLQVIYTTVVNQTRCRDQWNDLSDDTICILAGEGKGLCKGDSGGPLVSNNTLYGIVSFGKPCALGIPDVATRVSSYRFWINAVQILNFIF